MSNSAKTTLFKWVAMLMRCAYVVYYRTVRIRILNDTWIPERPSSAIRSGIFVFWHSKTFLILPYCQGMRVGVLTLLDWKNAIYAELCKSFGYRTVSVTSPHLATLELKNLLDEDYSIGIALDGPWGPRGVVKSGAFSLAIQTGRPIVPINVRAAKSFRLKNRWDQYEIPLPFSTVVVELHSPIVVTNENSQEARQEVTSFLSDL